MEVGDECTVVAKGFVAKGAREREKAAIAKEANAFGHDPGVNFGADESGEWDAGLPAQAMDEEDTVGYGITTYGEKGGDDQDEQWQECQDPVIRG